GPRPRRSTRPSPARSPSRRGAAPPRAGGGVRGPPPPPPPRLAPPRAAPAPAPPPAPPPPPRRRARPRTRRAPAAPPRAAGHVAADLLVVAAEDVAPQGPAERGGHGRHDQDREVHGQELAACDRLAGEQDAPAQDHQAALEIERGGRHHDQRNQHQEPQRGPEQARQHEDADAHREADEPDRGIGGQQLADTDQDRLAVGAAAARSPAHDDGAPHPAAPPSCARGAQRSSVPRTYHRP